MSTMTRMRASSDSTMDGVYPDKTTGQPATVASEQQSLGYNWQAEKTSFTDQNGTTHGYKLDVLGRLTADIITTLGPGVDGAIRRLGFSFNDAGLPFQQTSFSDVNGTSVVNQVQDAYNGYQQLTTQYQSASGAVNTSTTPDVQYLYSQPTGANYSRMTAMVYPNGRQLDYNYTTTLDSAISRVDQLADAVGSQQGSDVGYLYLGLSTVVQQTYGHIATMVPMLSYIKLHPGDPNGDAGDQYIGLDRFGRLVDQLWVEKHRGLPNPFFTTIDRFQYGYDQDNNVLYKNNLVNSTFSELYHANSSSPGDDSTAFDALNRLQAFQRGTLSASSNNGGVLDTVGTLNTLANSSQSFALDAVGNMSSVTTDGTATSRTLDAQNQITSLGTSVLGYDNNGNTTTDQAGNTYTFDPWNRIATVNGYQYQYDALGRRIYEGTTGRDLYYSTTGNVIEERSGGTVTDQNVWGLAYVNDLVLRDDNSSSGDLGVTSSGLGLRLYAVHDANWNVTTLINVSGNILQRFVYTPYGVRTVLTGNWAVTTDAYSFMPGFQGGRMDPVSGLVNFQQRDDNTATGTWLEQDPTFAAYVDGVNLYQAMGSNPVTNVDPTGRARQKDALDHFADFMAAQGEVAGSWITWIVDGKYNPASLTEHWVVTGIANVGAQVGATEAECVRHVLQPWVPEFRTGPSYWYLTQNAMNQAYHEANSTFLYGPGQEPPTSGTPGPTPPTPTPPTPKKPTPPPTTRPAR